MFIELIKAAALLLSLSLIQGFVIRFFRKNSLAKSITVGSVFGILCIVGMLVPIQPSPGVIFDPRTVMLSMAGLFGGPVSAFIAAILAGGYRLYLGGSGVYQGIGVVLVSVLSGLGYRYVVQQGWAKVNVPQLMLFGFILHVAVVVLFITQLPQEVVRTALQNVAVPLILIFTPATAMLGLLLKDIEDRMKTETALRDSESRLSHHLQHTPLAAISYDNQLKVTQWNKTAEEIFGYSFEEAMGQDAIELIVRPDQQKEVREIFTALFEQKGGVRSTNHNIKKDGSMIICEWYNTPILNEVGEVIGLSSLSSDVTAQKESEALVWKQANVDLLTQLANRQMAQNQLEHEILKAKQQNTSIAVIYLDLDNFKDVNDTQGHHIGDILLVDFAERLLSCVGETDTVARFGGDEFIIIIGGSHSAEAVDQITRELLEKTLEPFKLGEGSVYLSASIGVTIFPDDATDSISLLKNADQAMYSAKYSGGNSIRYFQKSMNDLALARLALVTDLRTALPNKQLKLYYQPIVNLKNGLVDKAEALIRWHHPEKGLISPAEFIPVAEETRMILEIGDWVFKEAVKQCLIWRKSAVSNFQITINTSPLQYRHENFKSVDWLEYIQELNLPTDGIAVEITEGTLMETHSSISNKLLEFRDAGIQVALDDFGTGYSSLSYLQKLDIDYLKIDKSFVDNLAPESNELALCEAIIVMAHKLNLKVVAEGIETPEQRELLVTAGCDYGQGYLFSKPIPAEEFESLIITNS